MAAYILQKTGYENKVPKILYLSGRIDPDYLRCLTLHGFKSLFGSNCHDYPKIPHIYKSKDIDYKKLNSKGMSYSNLLEPTFHNENLDTTLIEDIKNKYYDIIIYGSYHRGMPHYDLICSIYKPNEIILLCGEDLQYSELLCTILCTHTSRKLLYGEYLHYCNYAEYVNRGHFVFVREIP